MMSQVRVIYLSILSFLFCSHAIGATIINEYDNLNRLVQINIDAAEQIIYTYDAVGNRLSISSNGIEYNSPGITDSDSIWLNNTILHLGISLFGREYGNLTYEFAIGTTPCATDIQDWTAYEVDADGNVNLDGLDLPWAQEYYICLRVRNFAGDIVTGTGSSDGIMVIDPIADEDGDGATNQSEVDIQSNPLNPDSYPQTTVVELKQGFNLMAIPADVTYRPQLRDWLPTIGSAAEIDRVLAYDRSSREFMQFDPESATNPDLELTGGEGFIVYSNVDKSVTFDTVLCVPHDLQAGFNLVGFSCPPDGYSASDLATLIGVENVSSIQNYNTETGLFETLNIGSAGTPSGIDYGINIGASYLIYSRNNVSGLNLP